MKLLARQERRKMGRLMNRQGYYLYQQSIIIYMTQIDIGFLSKVNAQTVQSCLEIGVNILLKHDNIPKTLPVHQRILITKLIKLLQKLCKLPKKSLGQYLQKLPAKDSFKQAFRQLFFDRQLNNYQIIKSYFDKKPLPDNQKRIYLKNPQQPNICIKVEYRIQITLSSHQSKKVFKPLILLIFHMRDGEVKSVYADIVQFEEIRKSAALGLKTIHQIQSKG